MLVGYDVLGLFTFFFQWMILYLLFVATIKANIERSGLLRAIARGALASFFMHALLYSLLVAAVYSHAVWWVVLWFIVVSAIGAVLYIYIKKGAKVHIEL